MPKVAWIRNKTGIWLLYLTLALPSVWAQGGLRQVHAQATPAGSAPPDQEAVLDLPAPPGTANFASGSIMFVGNATVILRFGGFTIMTDPNFVHRGEHVHLGYGLKAKRLTEPAITLENLPPIDLILLSHLHGDHFDQLVQEKLDRTIPIVTTTDAAAALEAMHFQSRHPLAQWQTLTVKKGGATLRITSMPARHGPPLVAALLAQTMGSMLEFSASEGQIVYRIYVSGDTMMSDDLRDIPRRYADIDLALLHLGGTKILNTIMVTMDGRQGSELLRLIDPHKAIPIHYNDYNVFTSSLEDFERHVKVAELQDKVIYLRHGETYHFKGRSAPAPSR